MSRRYGKFSIYQPLIFSNPVLVKSIMGQCIITRAEYNSMLEKVEYVAISDYFDEAPMGAPIPEYGIEIHGQKWAFWKRD